MSTMTASICFLTSERNYLVSIYGVTGVFSTIFCVAGLIYLCRSKVKVTAEDNGGGGTVVVTVQKMFLCVMSRDDKVVFFFRLVLYELLAALSFSFICAFNLAFIQYDEVHEWRRDFCATAGYLKTVAMWIKHLCTLWIALYLLCYVVWDKDLRRWEPLFIIVSLGLPLLFCWIPFLHDLYGIEGPWCFIKSLRCVNDTVTTNRKGKIEQIGLYHVTGGLSFILNLVFVILTVAMVYCPWQRRQTSQANITDTLLQREEHNRNCRKEKFKMMQHFMAYPILFLILFVFICVNRICVAAHVSKSWRVTFYVLHAISEPLWGFVVAGIVIVHIKFLSKYDEAYKEIRCVPQAINT